MAKDNEPSINQGSKADTGQGNKQDLGNKNQGAKPESTVSAAPATRTMDTNIGLVNRRNHAITVVLKNDSFVLSPSARTGKDYKQSDIVTVNGMTLQGAVSAGWCSIIR